MNSRNIAYRCVNEYGISLGTPLVNVVNDDTPGQNYLAVIVHHIGFLMEFINRDGTGLQGKCRCCRVILTDHSISWQI